MISTINIEPKLRPCLIFNTNSNGERYSKRALFHRWVDYRNPFDLYDNDRARAMVELEDGTIEMVPPKLIKFLDPRHIEYDFGEKDSVDD